MRCINTINPHVIKTLHSNNTGHYTTEALISSIEDMKTLEIGRMPENMMMAMIRNPDLIRFMKDTDEYTVTFKVIHNEDIPKGPIHVCIEEQLFSMYIKPPESINPFSGIFGLFCHNIRDPRTGINRNFGFPGILFYDGDFEFRFISHITSKDSEGESTLPIVITTRFGGYSKHNGFRFVITQIK